MTMEQHAEWHRQVSGVLGVVVVIYRKQREYWRDIDLVEIDVLGRAA